MCTDSTLISRGSRHLLADNLYLRFKAQLVGVDKLEDQYKAAVTAKNCKPRCPLPKLNYDLGVLVIACTPPFFGSRVLTDTGGLVLVGTPRNQGACSTASALATVYGAQAAVATVLNINATEVPELSARDLYFCTKGQTTNCSSGWGIYPALEAFTKRALLLDKCLPYDEVLDPKLQRSQLCAADCHQTDPYASQGVYSYVRINDIWEARAHIVRYGGVLSRFDIYSDFLDFYNAKGANASATYKPSSNAKYLAHHTVLLVGYNDKKAEWTAMTFWGPGFADGGFFKVSDGVQIPHWLVSGYEIR